MAVKLRAPYHHKFRIFIVLLLLQFHLLSSISAQALPVLHAQSEILQVLVPNRTSFQEFVDCSNGPTAVGGFCIDVFKNALSILIPKPNWTNVKYTCYNLSSAHTYDDMVSELQSSEKSSFYDAVVGDITISAARRKNASFTQPYLDSGIVLLTPAVAVSQHFPGVFFAPFTPKAWFIVILSVILTGVALLLIESNEDQSIQGLLSRSESSEDQSIQRSLSRLEQLRVNFRFLTSVLIFSKDESRKSPVSKFVMMAWTVYILLVGSSYTASLSSILTINELSSDIKNIDDLRSKNLSIGYQSASVVEGYLEMRQNVKKANLVELIGSDGFANALNKQKVAAIADENPYISLFLADQPASKCKFLVSSKLTTEGLGFAFRDESLSSAFSVAILNLSESGQLQRLQDGWKLADFQCPSQIQATRLDLKSSQGLFVLLGAAMLICLLLFLLKRRGSGRSHVRLREDQQHDAADAFWEQSMRGSMRRWWFSSVRHQTSRHDFF